MTDKIRSCVACERESVAESGTGHLVCRIHRLPLPVPVNLFELMTGDPPTEDWFAEPLIPTGRLVGIVANRGDGKSLLALDIAASAAAGLPTLGNDARPPRHAVYLDMEMGEEDLYLRLADLGYSPEHPGWDALVSHFHYYALPDLPPLNTEAGGDMLEAIVERDGAEAVVVDTLSRVVTGRENDAEPYIELFRHTESRLRRLGITVIRLDHHGKDTTKGSRGHSAKEDPCDVLWELTAAGDRLTLKRKKHRLPWIPEYVTLTREWTNGVLAHVLPDEMAPQELIDLVYLIDALHPPLLYDAGTNATQRALQAANQGRKRSLIADAARFRKGRGPAGNHPGTTRLEPEPEPPGTTPQETLL